jgi:pyrroloquinoline quinone (PQQ) biosynthesis protein C
VNIILFWDIAPCKLVQVDWPFKGCLLHPLSETLHGAISQKVVIYIRCQRHYMAQYPRRLSFTSVVRDTTWRNIPEGCHLHPLSETLHGAISQKVVIYIRCQRHYMAQYPRRLSSTSVVRDTTCRNIPEGCHLHPLSETVSQKVVICILNESRICNLT